MLFRLHFSSPISIRLWASETQPQAASFHPRSSALHQSKSSKIKFMKFWVNKTSSRQTSAIIHFKLAKQTNQLLKSKLIIYFDIDSARRSSQNHSKNNDYNSEIYNQPGSGMRPSTAEAQQRPSFTRDKQLQIQFINNLTSFYFTNKDDTKIL